MNAHNVLRNRARILVLSDEPIVDDLETILVEIDMGGYVGKHEIVARKTLTREEVDARLTEFGSDPSFFQEEL